ncbi:MAG: hypothetical protein V2A73_20445 [Pseudomonadota bacterium]
MAAPATSASDSGLAASTSYSYAISAVDNAGNESARSAAVGMTTPACPSDDTVPPTIPVGQRTRIRCDEVELWWSPATDTGGSGLRGYNVYRDRALRTFVAAPATTLRETVEPGADHVFAVTAVDNAGNESAASREARTIVPLCGAPSGAHLWSRSYGTTATEQVFGLAVDRWSGDFAFTGQAYQPLDVGGGPCRLVVARYEADGVLQWSACLNESTTTALVLAYDVAMTSAGETVVGGRFVNTGTVDFGAGPVNVDREAFIAKYSSDGTLEWMRRYGAFWYQGRALAIDSGGNILLSGISDSGLFFAKFLPSGSLLWERRLRPGGPTSGTMNASAIDVDAFDNVVVGGVSFGMVDFGGGAIGINSICGSPSIHSMFLAKYSPVGEHLWSFAFGSSLAPLYAGGDLELGSIAVDPATNEIAVAGRFNGSMELCGKTLVATTYSGAAPTCGTEGWPDAYVAKVSASGTCLFAEQFGAVSKDAARAVSIDDDGNIVLAGDFAGQADFGGGLLGSSTNPSGCNNSSYLVLAKYSATGLHLWSRDHALNCAGSLAALAADSAGNILAGGGFGTTLNLGGGTLTTAGSSYSDMFLAGFSP